jgi:tetratricopeptide (TPR) repeat protein
MMSLKPFLLALVLSLTASAGAAGQAQAQASSNPVMIHYRAYRAAIERGDLVVAETEATAALEASVARSANGGNTGALAINLAQARLELGRRADAYEPALLAFNIASAGGASVDPLLARLVLGRAELTEQRWRQGRDRLEPAIEESSANPALTSETHAAAADLGRLLFAQEQYGGALHAWDVAMRMADAAGEGNDYARAEARMAHAAALFTQAMTSTINAQSRPTDTRLNADASQAFDQADRELLEAQNFIGPYAYTPAADGGLTLGQRVYASAMAWRTLLRAFTVSRGLRPLADRDAEFEVRDGDSRPSCLVQLVAEPRPNFPPGAEQTFTAGAAVVRFTMDENGQVTDSRVAAAIPERWFRDEVERVAPQWRIERQPESPQNCRYDRIHFIPIRFSFR